MIVTIDDYRGVVDSKVGGTNNEPPNDADVQFTVVRAGHLKLRLQALSNTLMRTTLDQHGQLRFDDILQSTLPRTYVNGSEEVYFLLKGLPWPTKIPEIFVRAYKQVLELRPFTNEYVARSTVDRYSLVARFAPTFSRVLPLLPHLDALCNTRLNDLFQEADKKGEIPFMWVVNASNERIVKPFAFMRLPPELRLHVYDCLVAPQPFVHLQLNEFPRPGCKIPTSLDIMRVCRSVHRETSKQFFHKPTLLIEVHRGSVYWNLKSSFTTDNGADFANRIENMSIDVRRSFTKLEIKISPSLETSFGPRPLKDVDPAPMRRIFAALPKLDTIVISYPPASKSMSRMGKTRWQLLVVAIYACRNSTLDWIRAQIPADARVPVLWDLTYFRYDMSFSKKALMQERWMRELIERDGSLELTTSATATRKDLERWSEIKDVVLEANEPRQL